MKKVVIVSNTHISRNPRVIKEAQCLSEKGYFVTVLTAIYSEQILKEDIEILKNLSVEYRFYSNLIKKNIKSFFDKSLRKISTVLQVKLGIESKYSLGYGASRLLSRCVQEKADLYIMHQELPTVVGCVLIKRGFKVGFDIEDYYSEDLLPNARRSRPTRLLKEAEAFAVNFGTFTYTTSEALSNHFQEVYGGNKPFVIRNVFSIEDGSLRLSNELNEGRNIKLYWFSQTIGPGRGLELLVEALSSIDESIELHLRGNEIPGYVHSLKNRMKKDHPIFVHPLLPNHELIFDMQNYDIGLALEPSEPLNKQLTTSNKLFHYLIGGLPVIISPTKGQMEILKYQERDCIFPFKSQTSEELANLILELTKQKKSLPDYKMAAFELAKTKLNWEMESEKVSDVVGKHL